MPFGVFFSFSFSSYRIVPNLDEILSPTKSDDSTDNEVIDLKSVQLGTSSSSSSSPQSSKLIQNAVSKTLASLKCSLQGNTEDDEIGDGLRTTAAMIASATPEISEFSQQNYGTEQQSLLPFGKVERRRRKLPEIPKNRKCKERICGHMRAHARSKLNDNLIVQFDLLQRLLSISYLSSFDPAIQKFIDSWVWLDS